MSKNSRFSTVFFIGLIYFIIQQIDNHLRQIIDFVFLSFFLDFFFMVNQIKENEFFFPLDFPWITKQVKKFIFLSLAFSFLPFFLPIFFLSHFPGTKHSLTHTHHPQAHNRIYLFYIIKKSDPENKNLKSIRGLVT